MKETKPVIIIGAGITGLSAAAFLKKARIPVIILEQSHRPGGVITTVQNQGFTLDFASNSTIDKNMAVRELIGWASFENHITEASSASSKRYILKDGYLHALKGPLSFIFTRLFSWRGKIRVLKETKVPPRTTKGDESLASFIERRFGREILDYAVNPIVAGIFAGKPEEISMKAYLPQMLEMEDEYGSVIKGMMAKAKNRKKDTTPRPSRKILSFQKGMQSLPDRLAQLLKHEIHYNGQVHSIEKTEHGYYVHYSHGEQSHSLETQTIISTAPAFQATKFLRPLAPMICPNLENIYYPPVIVLNLGYRKKDIIQALDSFGFLIPEKEGQAYLGAIWSSSIFPSRSDEDKALFTMFIGGARQPDILEKDPNDLISQAQHQFEQLMKIKDKPILKEYKVWEKAIPQYDLNHPVHEETFLRFEEENPGIFLAGNYRGGNAVADCIESGKKLAETIKDEFNS